MNTNTNNLEARPPVVAILGHIDHGKSTLLDHIRSSNIVASEAGGITQHIAAYEIEYNDAEHGTRRITFVDTPGHESFCHVRSRGATVADVAILIVSAEDGVMPQTKEALQCIKNDGVPFIVAINKIDTAKADIERTKNSLMEHEVYLEGHGGDIPFVPISAKTGAGISDLLSMILLVADLEELTMNTQKPATGIVVEAHKDDKRGLSATVIIKDGKLTTGMFVAGHTALSPVRNIEDTNGNKHEEAIPSQPIVISGWSTLPPVGSVFEAFSTKKEAEQYCKLCGEVGESKEPQEKIKQTTATHTVIPIIIKTDVSGTGEAIEFEIKKLETELVSFNVLRNTTGTISESDAKLASATPSSLIVGMGVSIDAQADAIRERENITIKTFSIIYELLDWIRVIAKERTPLITTEEIRGNAKILAIFNKTKKTQVLGAKVKDGIISLGNDVRIIRRDEEIGRGKIKELQQQKIKAQRIETGNEFGAAIETTVDLVEGDFIEAIEKVTK